MKAGASKVNINPAQTVMKHADSPVGKGRRTRIKDAAACYILRLPWSQVPSRESGMTKPVRIPDLLFARWRRNESGPQLP